MRFRRGLVLAILATTLAAPGESAASDPSSTLGVYVGPNAPAKVAAYEQWRGRSVARVLDFLADDDWTKISSPTWWTSGWSASTYRDRLIYAVPMLPRNDGTMQVGARGKYDDHFSTLARTLVSARQPTTVIRPGSEFNGS